MSYTLAQQLEPLAVDFEVLHKKYHPMLSLVNELIGVIPNCDPILEIWPTGFRTYNLLVPNFLDLPNSLWKGESLKQLMGLAMYTSSRAAECSYCSAHTCSFALRRGLDPRVISGERKLTKVEEAVVALANGMSKIPAKVTKKQYITLASYISHQEIEKIVLSISLMGFLNKFMDAVGVQLEEESLEDVGELLSSTGWTPGKHMKKDLNLSEIATKPIKKDNFWTYLRILKYAPKAIFIEKQWTRGVPNSSKEAMTYLEKHTGYSFPILENIQHKRVVKTLTAVLRDNLNEEISILGLRAKHLASLVYHIAINNEVLAKEAEIIITRLYPNIVGFTLEKVKEIANAPTPIDIPSCKTILSDLITNTSLTQEEAVAVLFTRAMSNSPAEVNKIVLVAITPNLQPESTIELGVWISIQQLLHRLNSYYQIAIN